MTLECDVLPNLLLDSTTVWCGDACKLQCSQQQPALHRAASSLGGTDGLRALAVSLCLRRIESLARVLHLGTRVTWIGSWDDGSTVVSATGRVEAGGGIQEPRKLHLSVRERVEGDGRECYVCEGFDGRDAVSMLRDLGRDEIRTGLAAIGFDLAVFDS